TSSLDFKEIKILVNYMIDPKKEGVVDYNRVKYWLDKFYPDKSSDGVLCIDLENELYNKLKGNILTRYKEVSDYEFELAETEYIKLVQFIKNDLPNLKIGYYGMPFRAYKIEELRDNASEKLDPILKNVDVLFPSMYIPFPATVNGIESNYDFLERH